MSNAKHACRHPALTGRSGTPSSDLPTNERQRLFTSNRRSGNPASFFQVTRPNREFRPVSSKQRAQIGKSGVFLPSNTPKSGNPACFFQATRPNREIQPVSSGGICRNPEREFDVRNPFPCNRGRHLHISVKTSFTTR